MTLLWSSLPLPRYQHITVETAVDQVKKDLQQVIEIGQDIASRLDAIGDSTAISQLLVSSWLTFVKLNRAIRQGIFRRVTTLQRTLDKCEKDLKASDLLTDGIRNSDHGSRFAFQGVGNVSDSEARDILDVLDVLVPIIEKVLQLLCEKKEVIGSLNLVPFIGSIAFAAGRLFTWATHVNVMNPTIGLVRSEMKSIHDRAMAIANAMEKLAPVCISSFVNHAYLGLISQT